MTQKAKTALLTISTPQFKRRLGLVVFSILLTGLILELFLPSLLSLVGLEHLNRNQLRYELEHQNPMLNNQVAELERPSETELEWMQRDILHPYLGFVTNSEQDALYNQFGFLGEQVLYKRSPDSVIVGLFGGSVAWYVYQDAKDELVQQIQQLPPYRGKEIKVVPIALGGFKQPQQLLALNYFLSLGGEFDIIINLDGFNEAALPYSDNFEAGITPTYPRHWNLYARKSINLSSVPILGQVITIQKQQSQWARLFQTPPFNRSQLTLLIWKVKNQHFQQQLLELNSKLEASLVEQEQSHQVQGPTPPTTKDEVFRSSLETWQDSSLQMARIAEANGARYYHVLQPNQYLPDSKILNPTERTTADVSSLADDSLYLHAYKYKEAVEKLYPEMRLKGATLAKEHGVTFIDLTQIFRGLQETIYVDPCCHYNLKGTQLIVVEIVKQIGQDLQSQPTQRIH